MAKCNVVKKLIYNGLQVSFSVILFKEGVILR